jgi:nucleotide-binding universal stress UspA family protein
MKVLFALEGLDGISKNALSAVLDRCWSEQSKFRVISVFAPSETVTAYTPALYSPSAYDAIARAEHEEFVERQAQVADVVELLKKNLTVAEVTGAVLSGDVSEKILEEADRWEADLIVCGTHGRHGLSKFFCGSVAEKIATLAKCSVEVVKTISIDAA